MSLPIPSPLIQLSSDGVTWGAPGAPLQVAANAAFYARLNSIAGVTSTTWEILTTDDVGGSPALSPFGTPIAQSAVTGNAQGTGTAFIFQATVNGEIDALSGNPNPVTTQATAKVWVPAANGLQVICFDEHAEAGAQWWTPLVNAGIRNSAGGGVADVNPTANTLVLRDNTGQARATSFATASSNVAGTGALRLQAGSQTAVAIKGQSNPTVALLSTSTASTLQLGDGVEITTLDAQVAAWVNLANETIAASVASPSWGQGQLAGSGATAGQNWTIQAQQGQGQTGGANNNSGGNLILKGGLAGTGGSGSAGLVGQVNLTGSVISAAGGLLNLVPVTNPTIPASGWGLFSDSGDGRFKIASVAATATVLALSAGGGNSALSFQPNFNASIGQDTLGGTGGNAGTNLTIAAQNGQQQSGVNNNNNGGALVLEGGAAGTGGSGTAGARGQVQIVGSLITFTGPLNLVPQTAPSNPASGADLYYDSGTTAVTILDSAGVDRWGFFATGAGFGANISTPQLGQSQPSGTGATAGTALTVQAQQGQQQSGVNNNNNGGPLALKGGAPGTGGSGSAGVQGNVTVQAAGTTFTFSGTALDLGAQQLQNLSNVSFATGVAPNILQPQLAGTGATAGQNLMITGQQGQNQTGGSANTNGGNVVMQAGAAGTGGGGAPGTPGYIQVKSILNLVQLAGGPQTTTPGSGVNLYYDGGGSNNLFLVDSSANVRWAWGNGGSPSITGFGSNISSPILGQQQAAGTGIANGNTFLLQAQQGQGQTGGANNNSGGSLTLKGGAAGTGGSGAAGSIGNVTAQGSGIILIGGGQTSAASQTAQLGVGGWTRTPGTGQKFTTTNATPNNVIVIPIATGTDAWVDVIAVAKITSGAHSGQRFAVQGKSLWNNPSGTPAVSAGTPSGINATIDETSGALGPSSVSATASPGQIAIGATGIVGTNIDWSIWVDVFIATE